MRRMNLFYSLLLAGFLATGYACLSDVPVFADELGETVTESVESVETTDESVSDDGSNDSGSNDIASNDIASDVSDTTVSIEATSADSIEDNAIEEEKKAETITESEKSVTGAVSDQTVDSGAAAVVSDDQAESAIEAHFDGQDIPNKDCITVTVSVDSNGDLQSKAVDMDGESVEASTCPYKLAYVMPSSWSEKEQKEFAEIMESYAKYTLDKCEQDSSFLVCRGVKYAFDPSDSDSLQLIDAEKYDYPYDNTTEFTTLDRFHCWAGQISNMLWSSGWAQQATDPLTGEKFASEDEVMTYFSSCFTDLGYHGALGIQWFFNGSYQPLLIPCAEPANRTDVYTEGNEINGMQQTGLITNIDFDKVVNGETIYEYQVMTNDGMHFLENVEKDGFDSKYYGIDIQYYMYHAEYWMTGSQLIPKKAVKLVV